MSETTLDHSSQRRLHVLVRRIYSKDQMATQLNIHCPEKRRCIDLEECANCPRCDSAPIDLRIPELLVCRPRVPERAESPPDDTPVEQLMLREVDCVTKDLFVDELAAILSHKDGGVLVVDDRCRPIGMVSAAEVPSCPREADLTVDDIMVPIASVLSAGMPIAKAAALMALARKPFLPVVGSTGEVIGLLAAAAVTVTPAMRTRSVPAGGPLR